MKTNSTTVITGSKVILIPYLKNHVNKYHTWMQDSKLQELTASEPLTLEEEFEMQQSWLNDDDKCTFIVLDKDNFHGTGNDVESMIGDVNLFFNDKGNPKRAEVEVMIAEIEYRSKGRGKEALLLMLQYGFEHLSVSKYTAKIKESNYVSVKLFQSIGFNEVSRSTYFHEITYELVVTEEWKTKLKTMLIFKIEDLNAMYMKANKKL